MRVLIFGKKGFLASKLRKYFNKKNVSATFIGSNYIDLTKKSSAKKLKKYNKKCKIIFLSALTPDRGKDEKVFIKNISMITNLFANISEKNIEHLIYISSDAVYNLNQQKITNNTSPHPSDLYGLMHFSRENICNFKISKKNLTILRPTIVYGKGDTHNSYGPNRFLNQIKKRENVKIFGKGLDVRDHLYVDDLINIIYQSLKKKVSGTYNVASGKSYQFIQVINIIKKNIFKKINIELIKVNQKTTKRYFDIRETKKKFNFKFTNLEIGIKKYIKYL